MNQLGRALSLSVTIIHPTARLTDAQFVTSPYSCRDPLLLHTMNRAVPEWRSERTSADFRARGVTTTPVTPRTWAEWIDAFTILFSSPNLIAKIAMGIMTVKQVSTTTANDPQIFSPHS